MTGFLCCLLKCIGGYRSIYRTFRDQCIENLYFGDTILYIMLQVERQEHT